MHREKGTPNIPQAIKDEILRKHENGMSTRELAEEYGKTFKTIKGLLYREGRKKRQFNVPKQRGRKPAKTLQEYRYENKSPPGGGICGARHTNLYERPWDRLSKSGSESENEALQG